jgi:hypothetical protein
LESAQIRKKQAEDWMRCCDPDTRPEFQKQYWQEQYDRAESDRDKFEQVSERETEAVKRLKKEILDELMSRIKPMELKRYNIKCVGFHRDGWTLYY